MSVLTLAGIGLLGGIGAVARFLIDGAVARRVATALPVGTLAVNLSGSLALAIIVGAGAGEEAIRLLATGLLGAYTTFSTWTFESHRLAEDGAARSAALNLGASLALGIGVTWLGIELGEAL
jgi:CrcB protein